MKTIYNETFDDFPVTEFPYDKNHSALGEYHHIMPEGYYGNFYDPVNNHQWRSMDGNWIITNIGNKNYLEQNRGNYSSGYFKDLACLLVHSKAYLNRFTIKTNLTLLSTKDYAGLAFHYLHSQKYYGVKLYDQQLILYKKDQKQETILMKANCQYQALFPYDLMVSNDGFAIKVFFNDKLLIDYELKEATPYGKVALLSLAPVRYSYLEILQSEEAYQNDQLKFKNDNLILTQKQAQYPPIEVIKKINLNNCGSARHFRIARVDGKIVYIFTQHQKKIYRDAYASISCISAIDSDGKLLWQIGKPSDNADNHLISCDLPIQVADINNDGNDEIIYAKDFEIIIADIKTGMTIRKMKTPYVKDDPKVGLDYPYDYLNVDAIRVADFTSRGYQGDFIIKDRYKNVWAYSNEFELLFRYHHKNTGHFPYIFDYDNDGVDEMFVGYDLVKNGQIIWSLPYNSDHTDEIIYVSLKEGEDPLLLLASGNEGFNVVDIKGKIIKSIPVGHAQRISVADYDVTKRGNEICVTSFWGSNGIIYTFDADLNLISEKEFIGNGNIITPINYDNSDNALILMSTSSKYGGLYNSNLDCIVKFSEEGQPTLASEAYDIDGDGVDEILTWNNKELWIYKAKTIKPKKYNFKRYPDNAFSNYRGEYLIKKRGDDISE